MNYQESILKRYKETFPKHTLKNISEETGIQMTRVFRLLNGAEMKLKEYEEFERILRESSLSKSRIYMLNQLQKCLDTISNGDLAFLETEINHLLKVDQFTGEASAPASHYPQAL